MKLSQDLYNSGALRRERLGQSNDWGFDSSGSSLRSVAVAAAALLGRIGETIFPRRSGGSRQPRQVRF